MKCKICGSATKTWYRNLYDDRHGYRGRFNIEKCPICGFAQTNPQIQKKNINALYSDYYPRQKLNFEKLKKHKNVAPNHFRAWLTGNLNKGYWWIKPNSKVLDIGSGIGIHLMEMEALGAEAYGIDPDKNAKKAADKLGLKFQQGFIENNPFPGVDFDYITANQVLEHTNNPIKFLKFCKERIKKNGLIVLSFPNTNSLGRKLFGEKWLHWHIPYHLNHFDRKSLRVAAEKAGLKVTKIRTYTPNLWVNLQIRRLIMDSKEGKRDPYWDPGGLKRISKNSFLDKFLKKLFLLLQDYNPVNRIIDYLGFGESFLVILKRDER